MLRAWLDKDYRSPGMSICGKYINIFTICTNRNQYDILMTAVADVSKGETDKSELQTLTK